MLHNIIRVVISCCFFFFQAEDGIRDHAQSRGLGDVYKRQDQHGAIPLKVLTRTIKLYQENYLFVTGTCYSIYELIQDRYHLSIYKNFQRASKGLTLQQICQFCRESLKQINQDQDKNLSLIHI
eukprot:TRINITY_DN15267_c0_g1_i2.p1 TRINITY_DN15267_c0_g1~~TRINITY_DN15267_c0_g1_i2.p1  ORF type:complete len:124 (+),score=13.53 TRINITY_DN15267_c0_g1_i2:43-414(+)